MTETTHAFQGLRRKGLAAVIAVSVLVAPVLSACSNPIESAIEGVTGGNVDIGGTSVPADFPAEVPLIDGEVVNAFAVGTAPDKVWTVTLRVADASVLDTIKTELEGAGFAAQLGDAAVGGITGAMYANDTRSVLVVIAEEKDGGWLATYTVGPAAK